jgi:hypothetical protein
MEVASPLTFGSAGTKRHYPGSPGFVDPNRSFGVMDSSAGDDHPMQQRAFKRRRFVEDSMESDMENSQNHAFPAHAMVARGPFSSNFQGEFLLSPVKDHGLLVPSVVLS